MLPPEDHDGSDKSTDTVAMIADALRQKFGAGALAVAELQRDLADEVALAKWDGIVTYLMV